MSDWFENDELFREQLERGHRYAEAVAERIRAEGIVVEVTPLAWRETIMDRVEFEDERDLLVGTRRPCIVEVKSRALEFSGPDDYPYPTAFVDTVAGWDAKAEKPVAIVLISQKSGGLAVIGRSTAARWTKKISFDHKRRIEDRFYHVEKSLLRPFDEFIAYLEARERPG